MRPDTVLRLRGITKRFGAWWPTTRSRSTSARGEVLALLGENGAGKTTLVSILFGHYVADEGAIEVFGQPLPPGHPKAALAAGIGMVHQHFTLADNLTRARQRDARHRAAVAAVLAPRRGARASSSRPAQRFGLDVDPDARIGDLSVGERQRVEILKALYRGARILILDEPTAVLTPQEAESLFATLRQLVAAGAVDDLHQPQARRGAARVASHRRAARRQAGRRAAGGRRRQGARSPNRWSAARCSCRRAGRVRPATWCAAASTHACSPPTAAALLDGVNLELRAGEIVAIAGVAGNGQQALAELLFGLHALTPARWS